MRSGAKGNMMSTLYTAYGFHLEADTSKRPCGMNTLVHLDIRKKPTAKQQRFTCELAAKRGYDTVVFFADDKAIRTVELW